MLNTAKFSKDAISLTFSKSIRALSTTENHSAPPSTWDVEKHSLEGTGFNQEEIEAVFYSFRTLADGDPDGVFTAETFFKTFSHLDLNILQRVWKAVFQKAQLKFQEFAFALGTVLKLRPLRARLAVIFHILADNGALTKDLSMDGIASHIRTSLEFMGYVQKSTISQWTDALWPQKNQARRLSYGEFVMTKLPDDHFVFDCFGLFDFLLDLALGRNEHRPPRKEGFLSKTFSSVVVKERWKKHWSVVRDGFFWYYRSEDTQFQKPSRVLTLTKDTSVSLLDETTDGAGFLLTQGTLYSRKFSCADAREARHWMDVIQRNCDRSFVSRAGISCRWMVDGRDGFEEFRKAILWAKQEIYITSWFLSAHVFLGPGERLDLVLKQKATEGVRVYIILWNETKLTLDLNSKYTADYLESLHPNILVLRHPIVVPMKWSHHQKTIVVDQKVGFVGGLDVAYGRFDDAQHLCCDTETRQEQQVWRGKNYYNPSFQAISKIENPFDDLLDRSRVARMPWHDVHAVCDGAAARDVARNFIERWNHHRDDLKKDEQYPYLVPSDDALSRRGSMRVRVLRSASQWSLGLTEPESSIYEAYIKVIRESQHFIYIENQFFVSSTAGPEVNNSIAQEIVARIVLAVEAKELFRVIVIVPISPEGSLEQDVAIRNIMWWQQKTICKGPTSVLESLRAQLGPECDISQYISFHSLRSWGIFGSGKTTTEQVYVHSKLIIVDDRIVIVGSANINDRSMLGDRDSEICLLIEDSNFEECVFNGAAFQVSRFAHTLRVKLWKEHLGLPAHDGMVEDPICEDTFQFWRQRSRANTVLFELNFPDIPGDSHLTLGSMTRIKSYRPDGAPPLQGIVGHLVDHPLKFLSDEKDMFLTGAAAAVGVDVLV